MNQNMNRRQFLGTTAIAGAGATLSLSQVVQAQNSGAGAGDKPALLGGQPVRSRPPREWPIFDEHDGLSRDGVHPTDYGYSLIAGKLLPVTRKALGL